MSTVKANKFWTEDELKLLRKFYPSVGNYVTIDELFKLFNGRHSCGAISIKAREIGLVSSLAKSNINTEVLRDLERRVKA